ncbi:MAG: GNAT family N-acetyltransferase [Anaerolineae bacterium]
MKAQREAVDEVIVRIADLADAAELARLNAAFNEVYEPPEAVAARLSNPGRVEMPLIATDGVRTVGFAALRIVPCVFYATPHAELTELYVEPAYRRRGIARRLVALAERLAVDRGADRLVILTSVDNRAARALYASMGYVPEDLAMVKGLAASEADT